MRVNVDPSGRVVLSSGAPWPGGSPSDGGEDNTYGVGRGSRGPLTPVLPSGAETARRSRTATTTTTSPPATWRAPQGPMRPGFGGRCSNAGRPDVIRSDAGEVEEARQEDEPVHEHGHADGHD